MNKKQIDNLSRLTSNGQDQRKPIFSDRNWRRIRAAGVATVVGLGIVIDGSKTTDQANITEMSDYEVDAITQSRPESGTLVLREGVRIRETPNTQDNPEGGVREGNIAHIVKKGETISIQNPMAVEIDGQKFFGFTMREGDLLSVDWVSADTLGQIDSNTNVPYAEFNDIFPHEDSTKANYSVNYDPTNGFINSTNGQQLASALIVQDL